MAEQKMVMVEVYITEKAVGELFTLIETGHYGQTPQDAAARLVEQALMEKFK